LTALQLAQPLLGAHLLGLVHRVGGGVFWWDFCGGCRDLESCR
jgi:hypothetical protein